MMVNNMLRKMKRSMSLLLAAAMLVSMAAGCGSSSAGNSGITQTTAAATTAEAETAAPPVTEEMYFPNGDKQIYAVMYKPAEEKESYPTVIISHGFAGNYEDNTSRAEFFAKNGYAAVVFDFYGGGRASKSGGAMTDMSVLTEATDLEAVMDGVRSLDYVDSSNLFLLGCSQGGFVSSYVAAQRPDDVAALVLLFPAFALQDDCWNRHGSIENIPETENIMNQTIGAIYSKDAMSFDIYEVIGGYKGNVLIQHGDKDDIVAPSYSEKAKEVYENAELQIIHGAGHGFQGKILRESNASVLEFLNANIK